MAGIIPILQAALGIGLLIFIHELGHYIAARMAGVRVDVFSLGFGTRLWGFTRGGTDYRISMVPLGGYVQVAGMDSLDRRHMEPDDLHAQSFSARAMFFSGGVLMNLLFALIAFPLVFHSGVQFKAPIVGNVMIGQPAWEAGLQSGDRILRVNDKEIYGFRVLISEVALQGNKPLQVEIQRGESTLAIEVTPRYSEAQGLYVIGLTPSAADEHPTVGAVASGSPAYQAGLRTGDSILTIDEKRTFGQDGDNILRRLASDRERPEGESVAVEIKRDGQTQTLSFVPGRDSVFQIGVYQSLNQIVGIKNSAHFLRRHLQRGDMIVELEGKPFTGRDLEALRKDTIDRVSMKIVRDGETHAISIILAEGQRDQLLDSIALGPDKASNTVLPKAGTPAERAGILPGDKITGMDGVRIDSWSDLVDHVTGAKGKAILCQVQRGATRQEITLQAEKRSIPNLGFGFTVPLAESLFQVEGFVPALKAGGVQSIDLIKNLYVTLKGMFTGDVSTRNLGGIVSISRVSYHFAQSGWAVFVYFLAMLSINLAFINVLPIPVLDGGHLLFLLIEKVKGSPVSARVHSYSQLLGLVFIVALMVFVTYNDILKML